MSNRSSANYSSVFDSVLRLSPANIDFNEYCKVLLMIVGEVDFVDIHSLHVISDRKKRTYIRFDYCISNSQYMKFRDDDFLAEMSNKVININSSLFYPDVSHLKSFSDMPSEIQNIGSLFSIPIAVENYLIGVMHYSAFPDNTFTSVQLNFLHLLTYVITTRLIENKLFDDLDIDLQYLSDRNEKSRFIAENDFNLVIEASIDGKFIYVNDEHEKVLGYKTSQLVGANIFKYIHPDDVAEVIRVFSRGMGTLSSEFVKFRYRKSNGNWLWLESLGNPYRSSAGEIRALVASREIPVPEE